MLKKLGCKEEGIRREVIYTEGKYKAEFQGEGMGNRIIICGCNGSGKSTLGIELARQLQCTFFDIEDYYFPNKNTDYIYDFARSRTEVECLLLKDMKKCKNFVLASVKCSFKEEIVSLFTTAVKISVDKEIRIQRVKARSFQKFGKRILFGGDLYEKEKQFFDMVESRTESSVDGTNSIVENIEKIIEILHTGNNGCR